MKLLRYTLAGDGSSHVGMASADGVAQLDGMDAGGGPIASIGRAIAAAMVDPAALSGTPVSVAWDEIAFAVPVDPGARMLCAGANYHKKYPLGGNVQPPAQPVYFNKPPGTLVAHDEDLVRPSVSIQFDYEVELAVMIGRPGRHIEVSDALDYVGGYSMLNDGSVRDWQRHSVAAGKNFYRSGSMGPWITTADEIADPAELEVICRVNGEERQRAGASEMIFSVAEIVSYLSRVMPLEPGDVIATGSPEGTGGSHDPPRWLVAGDEIEFEVPGIGVLRNRVIDE
ncbi:fumarylacetoacetate hydrolase family protein [Candidatus Poriferisodalis sp.]|uniref:fumarylacetoacetate hydrolase family protein n=1 Tax=Candidatus Poriferisodalis sp. TaxID=3101277 RepID=UPI003B5CFDB0